MIISPLTGSTDVILIEKLNAQDLAKDWERSFRIDISNELEGHCAIFLYRCKTTDLKFFVPSELLGSPSLYASLQQYHWYYMPDRWEYGVAIENLTGSNAILEIGSGSGSFLQPACEAGLNIEGIEVNHAAVEAARNKGLPVAAGDLNSLSMDRPERFDAVCAFQVLEHLSDPKIFITSALKLLKVGGKLILSVPNSESFLRHQFNLLDMPPHHMTRWSKKTFKALETLFPLKLEELLVEPLPAYQTQAYLAAHARHLLSLNKLMKILVNRATLTLCSALLKTRLRNLFTGQTLYVQFRKSL
jgi:2-polyprenyl-3-methyl-5-hydroxy-6-metoxy-1,4-benzoquinol methylase